MVEFATVRRRTLPPKGGRAAEGGGGDESDAGEEVDLAHGLHYFVS